MIVPQVACKSKTAGEAAGAAEGSEAVTSKDIGIQIYTLRDQIEESLEKTLEKVSKIGYKWIESYGYENRKILGKTPREFKELVEGLGMTHPSAHAVTELSSAEGKASVEEAMKITAEDVKTSGVEYLVYAYLEEEERDELDDYKRHAESFNKFGEICRSMDLQFCFHNHDFDFKDFDGIIAFYYLLENTDPELVKFEPDLYWIVKAGFDPLEVFKKAPGRFPLWHIKDMEPGEEQYFAEVGQGTIEFERIFGQKELAGMRYFFVEQDESRRNPLESVEMSWKYLNRAEFVG